MTVEKMSDPVEPDTLARQAGKDMYGSVVGTLRRVELWRLGNAWGLQFPVGASKDYMLPFFKEIEGRGENPLRPPGRVIHDTGQLRTRDTVFSGPSQAENADMPPVSDFVAKLEKMMMGDLKKLCRERGIYQHRTMKKPEIIARIVAAIEDNPVEQNSS